MAKRICREGERKRWKSKGRGRRNLGYASLRVRTQHMWTKINRSPNKQVAKYTRSPTWTNSLLTWPNADFLLDEFLVRRGQSQKAWYLPFSIVYTRGWSALRAGEFTVKLFYIKTYFNFIKHFKINLYWKLNNICFYSKIIF